MSISPFRKGREALYVHQEEDGAAAGARRSRALGMMVVASMASATHPRPKGATPLRVSLVPAFNACTAPNRTHGPPLAFPSCNPPVQSSSAVTIGSPDFNGAAANSEGS